MARDETHQGWPNLSRHAHFPPNDVLKRRHQRRCLRSVVLRYILFSQQALEAAVAGAGGGEWWTIQDGTLERQSSQEQAFFIFPGQHIEQTLHVMEMSAPEMTKTCYPAFTLSHLCTSVHSFVFFDLFFRKSSLLAYGWTACPFICVCFRASRGEGTPAPEMAAFSLPSVHVDLFFRKSVHQDIHLAYG
ncbi:hypothetical protein ARMGADRAFT_555695 [Armillaria gallica]|uniref:Uncharacterized protein n=1 Tax=Armillaria gallica TaxID=47427 RepID=A0A2H3D9P7_ARMGA|nr:hypothetical protein ARMGADRAFT_555695 [Armillaria gallica]